MRQPFLTDSQMCDLAAWLLGRNLSLHEAAVCRWGVMYANANALAAELYDRYCLFRCQLCGTWYDTSQIGHKDAYRVCVNCTKDEVGFLDLIKKIWRHSP